MLIKPRKKLFIAVFAFLVLFCLPDFAYGKNTYDDKTYDIMKPQKNILILNSYNQGLAWTINQDEGIIDTLKNTYGNCSIYVEDLDWKNYPYQDNLEYLKKYYQYKYVNKIFDIIITTDDAALNFALENRKVLFSNAPVVFSGVNQEGVTQFINKYRNFTGVIEDVDPTGTIKMALQINPSLKNVYVVFDNSESGLSTGKLVIDKINQMNLGLKTYSLNDLPFTELISKVKNVNKDSIVLMTTYYRDSAGNIVEFDLASREVSDNSTVPVYHLYEFGLNNGAIGGDMLSGTLNGAAAANMALRIIYGESADHIAFYTGKTTKKILDYNQLMKFNVPLYKIPKDVEIINKPFSFFETYKTLVISVLAAFIVLITFVLILLIYIEKIRRMKKEISERNEELTQIYEELVASDDELKVQLDEVNSVKRSLEVSEEKYTYLALHDVLTRLPNRHSLYEGTKELFNKWTDNKIALLFIDMDNFKYINDSMGHEFGDKLIIEVSKRLSSCLTENSKLYRLGGDEFIILLSGIKDQSDAEKITNQIVHCAKDEFLIQNSSLHISFSIGIAMFPEHGEYIEELIKCADIAMYKAKDEGKNRYVVYNKCMNEAFTERMIIEKHLHTAMEKEEFELYYQPQLDLRNNRITGIEALLRWDSPELGIVPPMKFIKVAEDTHLIIRLGEWALFQACAFIKQLHDSGYNKLTVSVNISTLQLLQTDFANKVSKILDYFKLDHSCLELEITETILIESFDLVVKKLKALSDKGIGIALDDFGKGYSSLSYLRQLPISTLKIDKCFIDDVVGNDETQNITQYIIKLGNSMGLTVIAEGVELKEQFDYLKKCDCDKIQGYYFSRPLSRWQIEQALSSNFEKSGD